MSSKTIPIPDLGDVSDVEVIELLVNVGDTIAADDPVIVLESAKASMDIPCPEAGTVESLAVSVGDKVNSGDDMLKLAIATSEAEQPESAVVETSSAVKPQTETQTEAPPSTAAPSTTPPSKNTAIHASPAVRRIATENSIDLTTVEGTGPHGRITKGDLQRLLGSESAVSSSVTTAPISEPATSHSVPLTRIQKLSAKHLHNSWTQVPHVTHFDDADITELENWRQQLKQQHPEQKLSLLPFVMKAVAACLKQLPRFNSQLDDAGDMLTQNAHCHIGIAVDTADGLIVPVIKNVDQKGVLELATELSSTAERARQGQLSAAELQGGSTTISNLGGIGGQHFTPIINAPEVSILGLGQSRWQLQRVGPPNSASEIADRLIQPLALSYDHRVIDGALAAQYIALLKSQLEDIKQLLL